MMALFREPFKTIKLVTNKMEKIKTKTNKTLNKLTVARSFGIAVSWTHVHS